MVTDNKYFLKAIECIRANGFDPRLKAHVGAIITRGGSIISLATNTYGPNSYSLRHTTNQFLESTHAEVNAIMQVRHKIDLVGTKLWIARLTKPNNNNKIALAKPCNGCKEIIIRHGIKRVCYTIDASTFAIWKPPKIKILRKFIP